MKLLFAFVISFFTGYPTQGQNLQKPKPRSTRQVIQLIGKQSLDQLQKLPERKNYDLSDTNLEKIKITLWQKYVQEQTQNTLRKQEYKKRRIDFGNKAMCYAMAVKGEKSVNDYPLQKYYLASVENGVYVIARISHLYYKKK